MEVSQEYISKLIGIIEEQKEIIQAQALTIESQKLEILELKDKIKELEGQLSKNSNNSSKPPSSNQFGVRHNNKKKTSKKKVGGQKGHKGKNLKVSVKVDEEIVDSPLYCEDCHKNLSNETLFSVDKDFRQEVEIELKKKIINHHIGYKKCPSCGLISKGSYPNHLKSKVQYGPMVRVLSAYLKNYLLLPFNKQKKFFSDVANLEISEGSLYSFTEYLGYQSTKPYKELKELAINSELLHGDETWLKLNGKRSFGYVFSNSKLTYLDIHKKRSKKALDEIGILNNFNGILMTDFYPTYKKYPELSNYFCNAHLLRELTYISETEKRKWSTEMKELLLKTNKLDLFQKKARRFDIEFEYEQILRRGFEEENKYKPKYKTRKQTKSKNVLDRLEKYEKQYLGFLINPNIPFTNNQAERDFRFIKVQQKISGGFRKEYSAKDFFKIASIISTLKKRKLPILDSLKQIMIEGNFAFKT